MIELVSLETIQEIAHQYGYGAVFFGILLENAGIPIPGETITIVGGFLAGSGELSYWGVMGWAAAGAVLGDNLGYWLGYYGGWSLLLRVGKLFRIEEDQLSEMRDRFSKNAAQAVILGRFVALLRIFAGPLAGIARMPYPQFFLCNLAGAGMWAAVMVSLAFFVGKFVPLEQLLSGVAQFAIGALAILGVWLGLSYWLEQRKFADRIEP
jgi:membrane protein DedA with SNARE-associated domain